ncbi:MAG: hypothetical protein JNL08_20435 [Planctomycetes bacterium]|nr:hypothetical protein [Planctomycetota bacterium]
MPALTVQVSAPQEPPLVQDLERLREMLNRSGIDGRDARESATATLLGRSDAAAHRVLQEFLLRREDPDQVRETILTALGQHVLGPVKGWFGGATDQVRRQVLAGYLDALAPLWAEIGLALDDRTVNPVRAAARQCLRRVPARELEFAARLVLPACSVETRIELLRCLADLQQVSLAQVIADHLEAPEEPVRTEARRALQWLTYHDAEFQTKAQFEAWFQQNGDVRYVDLAEHAARLGPRPLERLRAELAQMRIEMAREFVRAHAASTPGIDWDAIQARTLVDDPAVLDACLAELQAALAGGLPAEGQAAPRQAFCRAVLQRFRIVAPEQANRRALLLEVAAYLSRSDETELAAEVTTQLLQQLDGADVELQLAALRGLRRFPNLETRGRLVRHAMALLRRGAEVRAQLLATLATLSSRGVPRWTAPTANDPDKEAWLALVDAACRTAADAEVRSAGLLLAQTLDAAEQRVPELFELLLALVKDASQETKFRSTCLIQLRGWRNQESAAEAWVAAMQELLQDPADDLRLQAAESLVRLPESLDPRRLDWIRDTIAVLRERIRGEANPAVFRSLVSCLLACGREPAMAENAIGALNRLLTEPAEAAAADREQRMEPLLQALATIAAGQLAERGQWIAATRTLVAFEKRQSARLVLQNHGAADLARHVNGSDASLAEVSRMAMQLIIQTARLKPAKESWTSSEALQQEARDVRIAFGALDGVDEAQRLDESSHRLLRLEVELAGGKFAEAAQRASVWLANGSGRTPMSVAERDRMRVLAAEAQLALNKPDAAAKWISELSVQPPTDPSVLDLQSRIARVWFATDKAAALGLFLAIWKATPPEDLAFRPRLLEWMQHVKKVNPDAQGDLVAQSEPYVGLFSAGDCPAELRTQFQQLRGAN